MVTDESLKMMMIMTIVIMIMMMMMPEKKVEKKEDTKCKVNDQSFLILPCGTLLHIPGKYCLICARFLGDCEY